MTLILTETCHYALLVAIEEGAGFPSLMDHDIFIHSRLALHLPNTVGDLIPPPTIISAKPTKLVPNPQWRTTLVYFLSAKLLRRLRRRHAQVTLQIMAMSEQCDTMELGSATLRVDHAKMIKMAQGQQPLTVLKNYVVNKGEWKQIRKDGMGRAQIKAGLFIVDMPPPAGERQKQVATPLRHPIALNKQMEDDLGLEIYSADTSDCLTTHSSSSSLSSSTRDIDENHTDGEDDDHLHHHHHHHHQNRKTPSSPLGNQIIINKKPWTTNTSSSTTTTSTSTLSSSLSPSPSILPPLSITNCLRVTHSKIGQIPFLRIGDGLQRYTFVLRIVEATGIMSLIPPKARQVNTQKSIHYSFSEWQVRHGVITKGNSWQVTDPPMCLSLQGHLQDLQQWLTQQGHIEVCLVLGDETSKYEHTVGRAMVRLKGWCPLGIEQASFPIHDRSNRLHVDPPYQLAGVSVQLGLTEGWGNEDGLTVDGLLKRSNSGSDDTLVQQQPLFLQQQSIK
ncbi:unnamed protein product [Absidia cylindrospora]